MSKIKLINNEEVHLYIDAGVPWSVSAELTDADNVPISLVDKDITFEVRDGDDNTLLMSKNDGTNGGITNGGALGTFSIDFADDDFDASTWTHGVYFVLIEGLVVAMHGDIVIDRRVLA